nr:reverse transcriptase domain-containing protein [Tanacetum cinerariifolium]
MKLKHSLINMMTSEQFFGLEKDNPHDHVCWFNKITSTIKYKDVPNSVIKLILFPFSLARAARRWLEKEPPRSITTWDDLVSKFINEFFPPLRTTNLRNEISKFQQKFDESFYEAWERYKDLLRACAHPYYQCLVAGGNTFLEYREYIQGYVLAATSNYNQGNPGYRPQGVANQMRPPDMVKNELRNEMKTSIQTSLSKQTNEIKNMMASLLQMNTASTSGSRTLPGNTIANPKGELKAITTCSGLVTDGPIVPNPPKSVNPKEDECVDETELKCKALADLGASINLMPLSVWKKLGLRDLIPTRMTLELANRAICTPDGIARDVFVPVGKFTFPVDFVVVDYESDLRVPLILGRPFLRTARALIDIHGEEMILCDGDERLTLNMKHDIASYSNHSYRDSVNLINIFNIP